MNARALAVAAVLISLIALVAVPTAADPDLNLIPLIGVDETNSPIVITIPADEHTRRLAAAIEHVQESALPVIERRQATSSKWRLSTVIVGLGANVEAGPGPIIKASATPRFRVAFSNSADPAIP